MISREFGRNMYRLQLRNLVEHFPEEQILVLQHECFLIDMEQELGRTFEFPSASR
jgi:hypothetical protein